MGLGDVGVPAEQPLKIKPKKKLRSISSIKINNHVVLCILGSMRS